MVWNQRSTCLLSPLSLGPFLTFCSFAINLGLSIYDVLSLLTCFFSTKPSWTKLITMFLHKANHNVSLFICTFYGWQLTEGLIQLLIVCSGGTEVNPGPKIKSQLLFYHWSLNGLAAHNFIKVSLLQAVTVTHDYDISSLSETFLDLSIFNEVERIRIEGCNLRADHPSNKKGEVFVCNIKDIFHLPELCILKECLVTEIIEDKKSYFFRVYRDH